MLRFDHRSNSQNWPANCCGESSRWVSVKQLPLFQFSSQQVIDNHITVQEAAEITGYNVQYLRRLLRAGKLEAIKVGQIWLVNLTSSAGLIQSLDKLPMTCGVDPKGVGNRHSKHGSFSCPCCSKHDEAKTAIE